jgi:NADH-quinone oxidoreductase subunit N
MLSSLPQPEQIDPQAIVAGLGWIRPEVALTIGILLVVLIDLLSGLKRKQYCAYAALLTLFVASAFVILDASHLGASLSETPVGLGETLTIDSFSLLLKGIFYLASLIVVLFSIRQSEVPFLGQGEYYSLILSIALASSLLSQSQTLLMIFLSFEFISIPQYVLAGSMKGEQDSVEASLKYVVYGSVASGAMLFGFSLLYGFTGGQLDLAGIRTYFSGIEQLPFSEHVALITIIILVLAGMGFKISAVPFHMWSPDVYQGTPTPIVAFFSIVPKAAGLAFMVRFFIEGFGGAQHLNWPMLLGIMSVASMTLGNLAAIWQTNIKRLLAYSSIAHAGYILIGLLLMTQAGLKSMLFYIMVYLVMNLGIFVSVIALIDATGEEDIDAYKGLGWRLPIVAIPMVIFLFSLTGLPPTAGFMAKFVLFYEGLNGGWTFLVVIALLNTVVSLYYYLKIIKNLYFSRPNDDEAVELDRSKVLPTYKCISVVLSVATIGIFVYPQRLIDLAEVAARSITFL